MKGTDCTPEQLEAARRFLADNRKDKPGDAPDDSMTCSISFGQMVRVVAWYGALRYQAGRDGTGGTLECPGPYELARSVTP